MATYRGQIKISQAIRGPFDIKYQEGPITEEVKYLILRKVTLIVLGECLFNRIIRAT